MKTENKVEEKAVPTIQGEVVLNEETITKWKSQHGKIYRSIIDGNVFIWRKLKRKEYVEIMAPQEVLEGDATPKSFGLYSRQELITEMCTLWPQDLKELMEENGGLATSISDEVLKKSGFDIDQTVEL